jgi:Tfp pilus assembly protein PilO
MARSFDLRTRMKDRRTVVRAGLGVLLAANLVAAVFVFHPLGGSAEDLARDMQAKQRDLELKLRHLDQTRNVVAKVQQAKGEGDTFLADYILSRRKAYSTLLADANKLAVESGLQPKESSYAPPDPVEGSDTIEQLAISANYEGTYQSLTKFINLLDKSPRLIIESLQAAPQTGGKLNVTVRLDTFIQETPQGKS